MKKNIIRFLGYLFFGVIIYAGFLVSLFPFNSLLPQVSAQIKKSTGLNVNIDSVSLGLPFKLSMGGITLLDDGGEKIYKAKSLELSIGMISLLRFSPELNYLVKADKTTLRGVVLRGNGKYFSIDLALDSDSPKELLRAFKVNSSVALQGKIGIKGNLKIPMKALARSRFDADSVESAKFGLNLQDMLISLPEMPVKKLSKFSLTRIKGDISMERGQLKIDLGDITGDLNGSIRGKIVIMNPVFNSRLDIRSKFTLSDSLITRAGGLLSILSRKKGPGGVYTVDIKGSFLKPRPII